MEPQATTVPFDLRATLNSPPAEIAITFDKPAGTLDSPEVLLPQATTVPFDFRARAWEPPAEIAMTLVSPTGTVDWP